MPGKSIDNIATQDQHSWQPLAEAFYRRKNVVQIARELLGKILVTHFDGVTTAGRIVETEAYEGVTDKASHAWNNRRTARTEVMFAAGGTAYVYLCYGIHHLFNVVTNEKDTPHAVLIRAVEPLLGIEQMLFRTRKTKADFTLTRGPGNVSKALGITTGHTGLSLLPIAAGDTSITGNIVIGADGVTTGNATTASDSAASGNTAYPGNIYIATDGTVYPQGQIIATPRIGVDYAAEDALLPYRFIVKGNSFVSGRKS